MRDITIRPVLKGYVVQVGCTTVVFGGKLALLRALESYLENPGKVEKEYLRDAVNPIVAPRPEEPSLHVGLVNTAVGELALANDRVEVRR